jgi:hypothetical protein
VQISPGPGSGWCGFREWILLTLRYGYPNKIFIGSPDATTE